MATFAEHFKLNDPTRENLEIDPERDAALYVDYSSVLPRLDAVFRGTGTAKILVEGAWGQGKTHTLRYIEKVLLPKYKAPKSVFVTIGGLGGKSTFLDVYQQVFVRMIGVLEEALRAEVQLDLVEDLVSPDTLRALTQLQELLLASDAEEPANVDRLGRLRMWLQATGPTPTQAMKLGLGSRLRDPSHFSDLVGMMRATAKLHKAATEKGLALFIDEGAAFAGVLAPAAVTSINEGLRGLVDSSNRDLVVVLGLYRRERTPFLRTDVVGRLGEGQIALQPMLTPTDVESFVFRLWSLLSTSQLFSPQAMTYFAQQAIPAGALPNAPGQLYPRGLLQLLNAVCQRAWEQNVRPPLPPDRITAYLPARVS